MATLEVHDGRGHVSEVKLSGEKAAILGSDPECDVVLNDPRALPYHARLRWVNGQLRIEAFPEARVVEVNGKKVVSTALNQGDEIQIGQFRVFLQGPGGRVARARTSSTAKPEDALDWLSEEPIEGPPASQKRPRRPSREPAPAEGVVGDLAVSTRSRVRLSWWQRLLRSLNAGGAPGDEKLAKNPLILGLVVILGMLSLIGYGMWTVVQRNRANQQYTRASQKFDERDYRGAVADFDTFLANNSGDLRRGKARVMRELANVKQFSASSASAWNSAIEAARQMVARVGEEAYYSDARMDLANEVLKAASGLAQLTAKNAEPRSLREMEEALELFDSIAGPAAKTMRTKEKIPELTAAAHAAVEKARIRRESIATMSTLVEQNQPDGVFSARDQLVTRYPDLARDKDVVAQVEAASELVRKATSFDSSTRPALVDPHPDALGPPVSLVLRLVPPNAQPEPATANAPLVYAIAHGYVYGIDGSNGAPVWHTPVGMTSPFAPVLISGDPPSIVLFDARYNELTRLDGRTGSLLWRQPLGELVASPPLVLGNQVLQATPSGKLLFLNLSNGELQGSLDFKRPLSGTPSVDEAGQYFYVTGDRDCVFVVARDPIECVGVAYLGHKPGSIRAAPGRLADYLIVPVNDDLWEGHWSVFRIENEGESLRLVQSVQVPGWTWQTPSSLGRELFSVTDRNAILAFGQGPEGAAEPLKPVAATVPDARPSGPAFARARGDRELWISASRLGRFDLDAERGSLTANWTIERAGPALAPIQVAGRVAVFTHQFEEGPGVALWGVDPSVGRVLWKTVLGAPWPLEPSPAFDGQSLTTLSIDGSEVTFTPELFEKGGFVEMPLRRPGYFNLPVGPLKRLQTSALTVLVPAPEADHLLVRAGKTGEFARIDLPAPLGAAPLFWGEDLFVPGLDGRAYLVDPKTGAPRAEPYVPTFDNQQPTRWLDPVNLPGDAVLLVNQTGTLQRLVKQTEPRVRLATLGEPNDLKSTIDAHPAATQDSTIVTTSDNRVRSLSGRDLSALGAWNLDVPRAFGPIALGRGFVAVFDKGGGIMLFAPDGNRAWVADLGEQPPLGPPVLRDGVLWVLSRDGVIQKRDASDGSPIERLDLNILPGGGLWHAGNALYAAAAPGTVRRVLVDATAEHSQ